MASKGFGFIIIGTVDKMQSENDAKKFLAKLTKDQKLSDINTIHIFDWRTK